VGAAYASKLFAEMGAEVLALEPPTRHPLRVRPIHPGTESTSLFDYLFTNKRIASVDLESPEGRELIGRLTEEADVLLTDYTVEELDRLFDAWGGLAGVSRERIVARVKPLVGCAEAPAATYFTAYHAGGEGYLLPGGEQYLDRPPVKVGQYAGEYDAGQQAAIAAMAALYAQREGSVRGELVEVSVQGAVANMARAALGRYTLADRVLESRANRGARLGTTLPCADGFIELMAMDDTSWKRLTEVMGNPDWAREGEANHLHWRHAHSNEINALLEGWTKTLSKDEIRERCQNAHIAAGSVETIDDVLKSEQLRHRRFFEPSAASGVYPGLPLTVTDHPLPKIVDCAEIAAGQLPAWCSKRRTDWSQANAASGARPLPLDGVRVVEFTWYWAVPYTGLLLAALGAEVIKVESQTRPDPMRYAYGNPAAGEHIHETGFMYHDINLGKRSITLALRAPGAREIAIELVKQADVVLQNYSVGVMEKLGLGYNTLRQANPNAIIVSETACGEDGPTRHYVGYASIFGALSGLADCTGYPDAPAADVRDAADLRIATTCAVAALGLLLGRQSAGGGETASVSAVECLARYIGEALTDRSRGGAPYRRNTNQDPVFCPNNAFACRGSDRWIAISIRDDADWQRFRQVTDLPALEDPRFAAAVGRRAAERDLDAIIGAWTAGHDASALAERLNKAGVPASPVPSADMFFSDPVLRDADFLTVVDHPYMGRRAVVNTPWEFMRLQAGVQRAAPLLGEANTEVFETLLGMDPAKLEELKQQGVIR
jgi:crotonobetainyl-CoA:carnitine CoA-transferase CaiB-like acyl-CoA transferase